jgi:lambda repressor-like predicted transcriptional regulator
MKKLEDKIKEILSIKGLTIQRLAIISKISEPTLHAIFNRDDAKLSQLQKIAESLGTPLSFFLADDTDSTDGISQMGFANVSGTGNTSQINTGNNIGKNTGTATQHVKSTGDCEQALVAAQVQNQLLQSQLHDKERIIQLLELQLKSSK